MLLHHHFVRIAKKFAGKTAFIDRTTGKRFTYGKALTASLILAKKFRKYDKGYIGIMLPTSAGCAFAVIAALMSGRVPVMVNYSTGAGKNVSYAQGKCGFKTVITSRVFLEKIGCAAVEGMVFLEDVMGGLTLKEKVSGALKAKLPAPLILGRIHGGRENDDLVILFTSGSEKDPKAVQITHRNVASNIESFGAVAGLTKDDSLLALLPFFHVMGLTVNLWTPLYFGMTSITYSNPLDMKSVCTIASEEKPTILVATPSFMWGYLRKSEPGDFASLRLAVCGADKCPEALREEFLRKHGIMLYEGYGATETSPVISVNMPENNKPGSVGKVLPGVSVRIEDYETGEDCQPGVTGRIMVQGDLVMKGYFDDFEETSMRIRHGWYDTGDMGFLDADGYLWHAGRLKRFVKVGGEMVSLVAVENVLEKFLPEGAACCVVEIPNVLKGAKVIAVVTQALDERRVLKQMSAHLPNIALPRQFLTVEELPKMASGKIDFRTVTTMVHEMLL
jgi:acyl-[acyl-carrier-protein]-phospholipid O-acyltransferase/long-chain-fatty-acid--[acyl-carrier-protein] ligase